MSIEIVLEVLDYAPADLTPQERLAAVVFAEDARLFGQGHRLDRRILTPLDDLLFQRRIGVGSADKVKKLAQALARKGVLESVQRGQKHRAAEYRFARLARPRESEVELDDAGQHATADAHDGNGEGGNDADSIPLRPLSRPDTAPLTVLSSTDFGVLTDLNRADTDPLSALSSTDTAGQQYGKWPAYTPTVQPSPPSSASRATAAPPPPGEGGGLDAEEDNPATAVLLARIDFGRPLRRGERERLAAQAAGALADGWTPAALLAAVDGNWAGARDRVAVVAARFRDLGKPPPARSAAAGPTVPPRPEHVVHTEDAVGWKEARAALRANTGGQYGPDAAGPTDRSGAPQGALPATGDSGRSIDAGPLDLAHMFQVVD